MRDGHTEALSSNNNGVQPTDDGEFVKLLVIGEQHIRREVIGVEDGEVPVLLTMFYFILMQSET